MSATPSSSMSGASGATAEKDKDSQWYFTSEQLASSPSRRHGIDSDLELSYRQQTAYLIQEMGQRLQVSQLCINTAIVYMHRFYAFHSFTHFHRNGIAAASLFLAAKVEEQPRKLEHVIKAANKCLNQPTSSTTDSYYIEQAQDLVFNENVLLQTLGFDVAIDHPHTHVVKTCHLVKACKDLAQTSYFLASNSLHLTSMCLQYKPTVVACFCIYLACKWSRWEIPQSTEGKHWFHYVDKTVTMDLLKQLTDEFIAIYEKSPARLKSKLNSIKALAQGASNRNISKDKKGQQEEWKMVDMMKMYHSSINTETQGVPGSLPSSVQQQQSQQMQMRKSDLHSSQHRTHHNSHHHSKHGFAAGDVIDHKASHKQQSFGGNMVSRSRDHSQVQPSHQTTMSSTASSARSNMSSSSSRSSIPNNIPGHPSQRQPTQTDVNYKSRSLPGIPAHGVPPHPGHKMSQKQDPNRVIAKESLSRIPEQSKQGGNKIFPSSLGVSQYGSNQLPSGAQPSSKGDSGHDLSRNLLHNQRTYGGNSGTHAAPPIGYYQPQIPRQNSNNKQQDQSKAISVQMPTHHKQPIPAESTYGTGAHEPQQHSHQAHSSISYPIVRNAETAHSAEHSSSQFAAPHSVVTQAQLQQSKVANSLFSPDWNEKLQNPLIAGNLGNIASDSSLSFQVSSSKGSPKVNERVDTLMKKEKGRVPYLGPDAVSMVTARPGNPQQIKPINQKKTEPPLNLMELAGTSTTAIAGTKRSNDTGVKQEEELLRDTKVRKLDNLTSVSYADSKAGGDISKMQVVNGIETNPDLVRSLLKESLCTTSTFIKAEPMITPSLLPPAELLEPSPLITNVKIEKEEPGQPLKGGDEQTGSKAEKKKKKDKHKHKEKEKTKDREERKKHKKDKDRHKDRDRESDNSEPVKIKISKEKIETAGGSGESIGLKLKIPKDRITHETTATNNPRSGAGPVEQHSSLVTTTSSSVQPSAPALKIKISKDKLENYSSASNGSSGSSESVSSASQVTLGSTTQAPSFYPNFGNPNHIAAAIPQIANKKKDYYRDREKDKKRLGQDTLLKSNGSTLVNGPVLLNAGAPKTQISSKMQHMSNNMSQLFGESNDDDDDDVYMSYQDYAKASLPKTNITSALSSSLSSSSTGPHLQQPRSMQAPHIQAQHMQMQLQMQAQAHPHSHPPFNQPSSHNHIQQR